jgi:hypothetical protein
MISFETRKSEITKKIITLIDSTEISDYDYAMKTWWVNIRNTGGLCLTTSGDQIFTQTKIEHFDLVIDWTNFNDGVSCALMLDRRMPCPYYLFFKNKQKIIRVYDSRVALLITLQGGIQNFLKNKEDIHYRWNEND